MLSPSRRRFSPQAFLTALGAFMLSLTAAGEASAHSSAAGPGWMEAGSLAPGAMVPGAEEAKTPADGRVLVLGFDGADWRKTKAMMDAGELPNLAKLRDMGTAAPLVSTDPAESAAGWAAINTGANPLKNGVPSFINRGIYGTEILGQYAHIEPDQVYKTDPETDGGEGTKSSGAIDKAIAKARSLPPYALTALVFLAAFLLFKFVLRAHAVLALLIAASLGAAAWFVGGAPTAPELPRTVPGVIGNKVRLDGFWVEAARAGHPSVALQAPMAFNRPGADGARTLYGLGVPDVRSSVNGDWFVYTNDTLATGRAPKGDSSGSPSGTGVKYRVDFEAPEGGGDEAFETFVYGPVNFAEIDDLQRQVDAIVAIKSNSAEFNKLGFQESNRLHQDQKALEKKIRSFANRPYLHRTPAPLRVAKKSDGAYDVTIDGTTQTLKVGDWSEFYQVRFTLSEALSLSAITRARVVSAEPFELYIDTLQFDPKEPAFWQPVSSPREFSSELVDIVGSRFETLGWGCMTNQVKDKMVDPVVFLEDVAFTMEYRRKLMQRMLEKDDWSVLYSVFSATDRVQHMMYRYHDPEHPMYDAEGAAREVEFFGKTVTLADAIPAVYRQMDAIVGDALAALGPKDTLMLCADHGFTSYRRGMNVNNWLEQEGYLVLREGLQKGDNAKLKFVDWSKTRAYALGLGMVYLNLEGREPQGIVNAGDADALMAEICASFLAARDEGRVVGTSAKVIKDVYEGPEAWGSAEYPCSDIMLGFAEFYRTSWTTVNGSMDLDRIDGVRVAGPVYEDNDSVWSGDHASNDPNLVSGIFFCNRKVVSESGGFSVMDIAPTVLDRLGAPIPAHFDRKPLKDQ